MKSPHKIIIGGPNRSGTSLVRALIGSHSQICVPDLEPRFHYQFDREMRRRGLSEPDMAMAEYMMQAGKIAKFDFDRTAALALLREGPITEKSIYTTIFYQIAAKENKPGFAEKTTYNEQYFLRYLDWFGEDFRFVYMIRNPINTYTSVANYMQKRHRTDPVSWCELWERSAETALKLQSDYPDQFKIFKFEDSVKRPDIFATALCTFLDLPDETAKMIEFSGKGRFDNSSFSSTAPEQKIQDRSKVDRKDMLPTLTSHYLVTRLSALSQSFGYDIGAANIFGQILQQRGVRHLVRLEGLYRGLRHV